MVFFLYILPLILLIDILTFFSFLLTIAKSSYEKMFYIFKLENPIESIIPHASGKFSKKPNIEKKT